MEKNQRVLVTTLTKKMAESLTEYLKDVGIRVRYMHSDIDTIERMQIIRDLRLGKFDVLVGINLLREGLDLPEVSLVAILDADKEGFLRSETSLIQTIGRAARNVDGKVIMYADRITNAMQKAIDETNRRRKIQIEYNQKHGIVPQTVRKGIRQIIEATVSVAEEEEKYEVVEKEIVENMTKEEIEEYIKELEQEMKKLAIELEFEKAAKVRDKIFELKKLL